MNTVPFKVGDFVKVNQKVKEAKRERISAFRGQVLDINGSGENTMFTVRQNLEGIDVDRIFPLHSPVIASIEVVGKPHKKIRRATLHSIVDR